MQYLFQAEKLRLGPADLTLRVYPGETCAVLYRRKDPAVRSFTDVLTGRKMPDGGRMLLSEEEYVPRGPEDALARGVCLAGNVFGGLTVRENLALLGENADPAPVRAYLKSVRAGTRAEDLSAGEQTALLLLRSHLRNDALLVLRDPFDGADPDEREELLQKMRTFTHDGRAVLYFTARPSDARRADRCAVMSRDGIVWSGSPSAVSADTLADLVCGEEGGCLPEHRESVPGAVIMEVRGLGARSPHGPDIRDVSLEIRENEILGLCALPGEGGETLLRTLAGLIPAKQGRIRLMGSSTARLGFSALYKKGVRFLPSRPGPLPSDAGSTVLEELVSRRYRLPGFWNHGFARTRQMRSYAEWILREYGISASPDDPMDSLPPQARARIRQCGELDRSGPVLLLEYPARGLDHSGAQLLWDLMNQEKAQRTGILYLSDDPEELVRLCDRIAVMRDGRIVCVLDCLNTTENEIAQALAGRTSFSYDLAGDPADEATYL